MEPSGELEPPGYKIVPSASDWLVGGGLLVAVALVLTFSRGSFAGVVLVVTLFLISRRSIVGLLVGGLAVAVILFLLPDASRHPLVVLALVGLLPAFVIGLVVLDLLGRIFVRFSRFRIVRPFLELASLMERLRRMPGLTALVIAISLAGHVLSAGAFYILARQLELPIGYWPMFALSAPIIVYSAVPISVGGWGVREALSAALFGLIGVAPASGVALSIAFGLLTSAVGLFCGGAALAASLRSRAPALRKVPGS